MPLSLDAVRNSTRAELVKLGLPEASIDLSYLTQELLDEYNRAPRKSHEIVPVRSDAPGVRNPPCFYGNNRAHLGGNEWAFTNANSSDRCDQPAQKCGSGYRWRAPMNTLRHDPCPGDSPPGGLVGWAVGYDP